MFMWHAQKLQVYNKVYNDNHKDILKQNNNNKNITVATNVTTVSTEFKKSQGKI
jgi:hypothetical protein